VGEESQKTLTFRSRYTIHDPGQAGKLGKPELKNRASSEYALSARPPFPVKGMGVAKERGLLAAGCFEE
jgi:hypothetical protein